MIALYDHADIDIALDGLHGTFSLSLFKDGQPVPGGEIHVSMETDQEVGLTMSVALPPSPEPHQLQLYFTETEGEVHIEQSRSLYARVEGCA